MSEDKSYLIADRVLYSTIKQAIGLADQVLEYVSESQANQAAAYTHSKGVKENYPELASDAYSIGQLVVDALKSITVKKNKKCPDSKDEKLIKQAHVILADGVLNLIDVESEAGNAAEHQYQKIEAYFKQVKEQLAPVLNNFYEIAKPVKQPIEEPAPQSKIKIERFGSEKRAGTKDVAKVKGREVYRLTRTIPEEEAAELVRKADRAKERVSIEKGSKRFAAMMTEKVSN